MLDALLQPFGINLKNIGNLADTARRQGLLVDVDIAVVGTPIGSIDIEIHCSN